VRANDSLVYASTHSALVWQHVGLKHGKTQLLLRTSQRSLIYLQGSGDCSSPCELNPLKTLMIMESRL